MKLEIPIIKNIEKESIMDQICSEEEMLKGAAEILVDILNSPEYKEWKARKC